MLGLYVHVPFCASICNYCNFSRRLFDAELKTRYVDALVAEIASGGGTEPARGVDTIYFGGGTPSLLAPEEVARVLSACDGSFSIAPGAEVTLEANPETVNQARLEGYRAAGVNRLSFGVQSLRDDELERLGRLHRSARARAAVGEARAAGFDNLSLDLMMWLPQQRVADWLESIEAAVALDPDHLSLYLLEVYPHSPLAAEMARRGWSQAPDEDAAAMYLEALERLDMAGFAQYEIANVATPGRASRHNLKYWRDGEWLGFGCAAHSTVRGVRWHNVAQAEEYVGRVAAGRAVTEDIRSLTPDERLGDALFTGLRLTAGVELATLLERYGVDVWARYGDELAPFVEIGWLRRKGDQLSLSRNGMLMAHEVMAVFV